MQRTPVKSSTIAEIGYETSSATLEILFLSGGTYQYFDVPESQYSSFLGADSKGKYFHANIRDAFRCVKL